MEGLHASALQQHDTHRSDSSELANAAPMTTVALDGGGFAVGDRHGPSRATMTPKDAIAIALRPPRLSAIPPA